MMRPKTHGHWDDDKAKRAVSKAADAVGHIPATTLAGWSMTDGEVRFVLPGSR